MITFRKHSNSEPFVNGPNDDGYALKFLRAFYIILYISLFSKYLFCRRIIIETNTRERGDQMESTGIIIISKLNRTDDGLYECIAQNDGMYL